MPDDTPKASHDHHSGQLDATVAFLKRAWAELRALRFCRVWTDRVRVYDVNGDSFEVRGVGYSDADVHRVLEMVNAAYNRETIHTPTDDAYKEFKTGRRYTWALDRVM